MQISGPALQLACLAASLLATVGPVQAQGPGPRDGTAAPHRTDPAGPRLGPGSTLRDLLDHPAFRGFAPLLLPWDGRSYDPAMTLGGIGALLPYHTHVDGAVVAAGLNRLIDDAGAGRTIFYEIYTAEQRQRDPSLARTGLFFVRGTPGAPFAIVSPGGGFSYVGSVHEGFPYAAAIGARGYNAFVLKYRTGAGGAPATQDLAAALGFVLRNAGPLGVAARGYSLWGSSAGARMAAAIGSHGAEAHGGEALPRPAAVVMAYTAHGDLGPAEPPTFVAVGEQDGIAPPATMALRVAALRRAGTPVAFHRYPGLGHGFGPGTGTAAEGWIDEAIGFWADALARRD